MNYAAQQQKADAKIRKQGGVATMEWDAPGVVADVVTDQPGKPDEFSTSVSFAAFPITFRGRAADGIAEGTEVLTKVRRFLMGAYQIAKAPAPDMRIVGWEGQTWTIESCAPLSPDGVTAVLFSGFIKQ